MKQEKKFRHGIQVILLLALCLSSLGLAPAPDIPPGPQIQLQYATFDPLSTTPEIPAQLRSNIFSNTSDIYLLQFTGPIQETWKKTVENSGVKLYGYIPDYAFIARIDKSDLSQIRNLSFVRWVGAYQPAYRLASSLQATATAAAPEEELVLTVQVLPDADMKTLAAQAEAMGAQVEAQASNASAGYMRIKLPAGKLNDLANWDEVLWIEPYMEHQLFNDVGAGTIMRAEEVRSNLGLYGEGQIVAVADSGLDTGNTSTLHPDVNGRVIKTYALGRTGDWSDPNGHGTHVAGSVLGNGTASGSNPGAHQYTGSYAGTAPEAQLVFQSTGDADGGLNGIPMDEGDLMRDAYNDGARIHTNSWGGPTGGTSTDPEYGGYVLSSQQVDQAMWEHKDMLVLFAAGNQGEDTDLNGVVDLDSMAQPATAKNILTVGASENDRGDINASWGDYYGSPISSDMRSDDPDGMAAFSSRGPTDDGRIKPDVTAPGTFIASMRTRQYVFNDDLEGDTSGYGSASNSGGTGAAWQLITGDAHSSTHAWKSTVSGSYTPNAATMLLLPTTNVAAAGSSIDLILWHKYNLGGDNKMMILITDDDLSPAFTLKLNTTGSQGSYQLYTGLSGLPTSLCSGSNCIDPTQYRIGLGITSESGSYNSEWWIDDLRMDGSDWGTLSGVGMATAGDAEDEAYILMGGTSMATPLTAGAAAIIREWLVKNQGMSSPSAALMKALFINGAVDMSPGQYGTGTTQEIPGYRPNPVSGWGRVDLVETLMPEATLWFTDTTAGLTTGNNATYSLNVNEAGPMRAVLVWTDYPGTTTAGKALVNDLDLEIVSPGGTHYYGNSSVYPAGNSCLRDNQWDQCNNTEGVFIANATPGTYEVIVHGYNIPNGPQPFAVAATGNFQSQQTNTPPTLKTLPDRVVPMDKGWAKAIYLPDYVSDAQDSFANLTIVLTSSLPSNVAVAVQSGYIAITPATGFTGTADIDVLVRDTEGLTATDTFQVEVTDENIAPTISVPDQTLDEGTSITLDLLEYTEDLDDAPENLTFTLGTQSTIYVGRVITNGHYLKLTGYEAGTEQITVQVQDEAVQASDVFTVTVVGGDVIYLPIIKLDWPPIPAQPTLNSISNPDGDGNYTVSWAAADRATNYVLEEATDAGFSNAQTVYSGGSTSYSVSGKATGIYYYRVKGTNSYGSGAWSGVQTASVVPPSLFYATEDASLLAGSPNLNDGSDDTMWVGYHHCGTTLIGITRGLVKFDLSAIPQGAQITNATLALELYDSCDIDSRKHTITTYRVTNDWSESSVTWNSKPGYGESHGATTVTSWTQGRYYFNVTGLVQAWINGTQPNYGIMLRGPESSGNDSASQYFLTSEAGQDYAPYITITYAGMAATESAERVFIPFQTSGACPFNSSKINTGDCTGGDCGDYTVHSMCQAE